MALACKKCGKQNIDNEAINARSGGFFCRDCDRLRRYQGVALGCLLAVIGTIAAMLLVVFVTAIIGG